MHAEASAPSRRDPKAIETAVRALTARFGNRVVTSQAVRQQHGNTVTWIENQPPDAVVFPQSTEDVQEIVRICAAHRVPIIPFGTGTSLEGHVNAPQGGVSIDVRDMNQVLAVHAEDLDCVVQPGITRKALNEYLRDQGVFFPIDPGADASLGGMAATRCSGTNAVRYGTMKDNVLSLKVVMANGELMTTARRAKKSSAGYDLTRHDGRLGRHARRHHRADAEALGHSRGDLRRHLSVSVGRGLLQRRHHDHPVRHSDRAHRTARCAAGAGGQSLFQAQACARRRCCSWSFTAPRASVAEQSERFGEIAEELGGGPFEWTVRPEERTRLWEARHNAAFSTFTLRPGASMIPTDVCVPISRLAECVTETQRDIAESNLIAPIVGHVGDGNFHLTLLVDMENPDEIKVAKAFNERLVERALAMDGTCTGEHGVGQGKMKYLLAEHGAPALEAMRAIKQALDPQDIMNPGKIFALSDDHHHYRL